jgi:hypothetical protein
MGLPAVGFDGEAATTLGDPCVVVEPEMLGLRERPLERSLCTVAARSSSVRATVVIGMLWWLVVSRASRERDRCRRMPAAPCRLAGAVTSTRAPP